MCPSSPARAHLDNVVLETAVLGGTGERADWVEECLKDGYLPGSLSTCGEGYTRDPPNGNEFDACVPCNCNGHGTRCDALTGDSSTEFKAYEKRIRLSAPCFLRYKEL